MARSVLGVATKGRLRKGTKPTLHLATKGLIRITDIVTPTPVFGRGGWPMGVFYAEHALR